MTHLEVCLKAAVALEKWPGPIVAPRGSGHRYGGPTWAQQPQAHGAGADQDGAGRSWGASASGSRPLGLGGFASVWLRGPGCGGSVGPACEGAGRSRAEAGGGQVELPAACTQGPALGGSPEAHYPHTRPRGMVGSPGITPGPQESDSIGRPARADCWPEGWGWGWVRGEGSAGSWCWMGHQCPCTSRATASCRGQMDRRSSVGWKPDCDVTPGSRVCAARRLPGARRPRPGPGTASSRPAGAPSRPARPGHAQPRSHPVVTPQRIQHNGIFALFTLKLPDVSKLMSFII